MSGHARGRLSTPHPTGVSRSMKVWAAPEDIKLSGATRGGKLEDDLPGGSAREEKTYLK